MVNEGMNDAPIFLSVALVVIGLALLLMGRRLFWFFVGAVGFFAGQEFGAALFPTLSEAGRIAVAVGLGVVGALLAIVLQRLAVILAGGVLGGMLAVRLAPELGLHTDASVLLAFAMGALLVAVLIAVLFEPGLVVVSAVAGAVMIAEALPLDKVLTFPVIVVLAIAGGVYQMRRLRRR